MSQPDEHVERTPVAPVRTPWERPTLTLIGNVKDLVLGFGKSGQNADSDPNGPGFKHGVG